MGDRANVYVKDRESGVYLYTHWGGSELPETVGKALQRRLRWTDGPYLARIIFDQMTEGSTGSETGNGISSTLTDNEYPILVVNCDKQTVGFAREGEEPQCFTETTFEEYISDNPWQWPKSEV